MSQTCPICNNEFDDSAIACPFCGFRILGSTQSFTPVKLNGEGDITENAVAITPQLRVIRGPQTGAEIDLSEGTISMGRDPGCDVFLNDMTVSRNHATIEIGPKGCIIKDMNSFNGVWVNDRMVDVCLLKSGDIIQIGAFCLLFKDQK